MEHPFARRLNELKEAVEALNRRTISRSSSLEIIDPETGEVRIFLGAQPDGTFTIHEIDPTRPALPSAPGFTVWTNQIRVNWDGRFADDVAVATNLLGVEVHLNRTTEFGETTRVDLLPPLSSSSTNGVNSGIWYLALRSRTASGVVSDFTAPIEVTVP